MRTITRIEKCNEGDEEKLLSFLKKDMYYHTFILADIYHYGFDKPYQQIYMEIRDEKIQAVFLRYFTNLIIAGEPSAEACCRVWELVREHINTVMGKLENVKRFAETNQTIMDCPIAKQLYILDDKKKLKCTGEIIHTAKQENIDEIYEFLMEIPGFQSIYGEKQMIQNRIEKGEGEHLFFVEDGKIMAHANTAASTPWACMLGGISVRLEKRHQGMGHKIVSAVAKRALNQEKIPSVFSEWPQESNLFYDLGFRKIGDWGVLNITKDM